MTAKALNIAPLNAIFSRKLGRFWPSWLYSFELILSKMKLSILDEAKHLNYAP